ncbi:hypothetical protein EW145_g5665 [Phellinidium pouzarii]|uniref:Uncharacterized protein n=1 Tax=Phellinidium pouzarii TaxID=167371 RepID=A0A4S4KZF1_9AGAM|nr:hypothetical protein EW145_g5665 [Phellinidium pouzarii]
MARDSIKYFIRIFVVCFIGTCCNLLVLLDELKFKSKSVVYYGPVGALTGRSQLSWDLAIPASASAGSIREDAVINVEEEDAVENNEAANILEEEQTETIAPEQL